MSWQTVLGFEIHIELSTQSKMFCSCSASHFGVAPNTHVCPVCLGLPGALPVPNAVAIEWCIKLGLALGCKINLHSKFDRKNYFYPDIPKGYQISQYDLPFCYDGNLLGHKIRRVHMEEDTGKLQHQGAETLIDFNRSGVPLVEVVTEADFVDANDSDAFLKELQAIIRELKISNADMEKGSMRLEANISVKPATLEGYPPYKVEIKNVNSFRFVKKAVEYEIARQTKALEAGEKIVQETRGFKENTGETFSQRAKEEANDYRYFPDPDIPPIEFKQSQIDAWRDQLPKLPADIRAELAEEFKLPANYVAVIAADPEMLAKFRLNPTKATADALVNKREVRETVAVSDDKIMEVAKSIIAANPKAVADIKSGKTQIIGFLIGQVKKQLGEVDAATIKNILEKLLLTND